MRQFQRAHACLRSWFDGFTMSGTASALVHQRAQDKRGESVKSMNATGTPQAPLVCTLTLTFLSN